MISPPLSSFPVPSCSTSPLQTLLPASGRPQVLLWAARDVLHAFPGLRLGGYLAVIVPRLGFVSQQAGLRYGPTWARADMTDLQLIRAAAGAEAVVKAASAVRRAGHFSLDHPGLGRLYAAVFSFLMRARRYRRLLLSREPGAFRRAAVDERNRHAADLPAP